MRRTRLLYDGLWRCLCPSFDERALRLLVNTPSTRQPLLRPSPASYSRSIATTTATTTTPAQFLQHRPNEPVPNGSIPPADPRTAPSSASVPAPKSTEHWELYLLRPTIPSLKNKKIPRDRVTAALRILRSRQPPEGKKPQPGNRYQRILQLVNYLVVQQNVTPDAFLYECMMDAMVDPRGSASGVRALLKDMAEQGITPTETICRSALEALAMHGDYLLRQEVIETMRRFWYPIDIASAQNIALGLLRDGQYEMAYAKLTDLVESKERVDLWIYDIFITVLGQAGFFDEVLQLLYHRKHAKGTDDAFRSLLFSCLDMFSRALHYQGTIWVWNSAVKNGLLNPSDGILDNVLATAARHGDPVLAAEIIDILGDRGRVHMYQYEALVDAFAGARDVPGAMRILSIMARNSIIVGRGTTRTIYQALKQNPDLIDAARATLDEIHKDHEVPFPIVAVMVEALAKTRGADAALGLYHDIFALTSKCPDYPIMKDMVLSSGNTPTTYFLAKDYAVMIADTEQGEDAKLYNEMIPACAESEDLDLAFRLASRIMSLEEEWHSGQKAWRYRPWVQPLLEAALEAQDQRIWPIVDEMDVGDDSVAKRTRATLQRFRMVKRAEDWEAQKQEST